MVTSTGQTRRSHWWWALWIALGLATSVQVLRMRIAESAVRNGNGVRAALVRPQNGWGLALLADSQFKSGNAQAALQTSRAALRRTPLAVIGIRTLARAQDKLRGGAAGDPAWQVASLMGWRDKPTQLWAVVRAISNRDADVFAIRADALMRIQSDDPNITSVIRQALTEPQIRHALIKRLAMRPKWRSRLFTASSPLSGRELEGTVATLRDLGSTSAPPSAKELRDSVLGLINAGRFAEAVALDRQFIRRTPANGSLIGDGGFEAGGRTYRDDTSPFDWMTSGNGASLDESGGERSLVINTNANANRALERYMSLAPGAYRLSYAMQGPRQSPASIAVQIFCANAASPIARSSILPLDADGWNQRAVEFTTAADCPIIRILVAEVPGSDPVEALVDNFRLTPAGAARQIGGASGSGT